MAQLLMGGGVALAALSSAFAFVVNQLSSMGPQGNVLLGVTSLLALVLVPTAVITWLQLHQTQLGPGTEAGGWAINDRLKLDAYLSDRLTRLPQYPKGARHYWRGIYAYDGGIYGKNALPSPTCFDNFGGSSPC